MMRRERAIACFKILISGESAEMDKGFSPQGLNVS
jgi:hypothetical protein